MKELFWVGSSREDLCEFPEDVRRAAGYELRAVQNGDEPSDWKPMSGVGAGVCEIRIRDENGAFRVFYVANKPTGVYVLHAFQKKTQKTPQQDIDTGKRRFKAIE